MQTRDIQRRIRSVKNTQQITRAMKFVAAAKLRRAQDQMLAMRPYADAIDGLIKHVAEDLIGDEHPIFTPHPDARRAAYVLIASDRGLCGGFNTNIFRAVDGYIEARRGVEPVFFAIGKRTVGHLRQAGRKVIRSYFDVFEKLSYIMAGDICDTLVASFSAGSAERVDEAYVVYNEFASMLTQRPVIRKLLPIDIGEIRRGKKAAEDDNQGAKGAVLEEIVLEEAPDDIFDVTEAEEEMLAEQGEIEAAAKAPPLRPIYELLPDPHAALEKLMARRMATEIYRGMLESYAAELAARMSAMDAATANAEEMVSHLTLDLNRARQTGITMELLDIIGGSDV